MISTEELQGCLTALGHIVESNDPAKVDLKTLFKKTMLNMLKSKKHYTAGFHFISLSWLKTVRHPVR